jgi:hypothetical protein
VSVYESGSNDLTRQWMSLLRMLLLPLRVPHVFTANGALRPRPGLSRIELLAALRNALVEPFVHVSVRAMSLQACGCCSPARPGTARPSLARPVGPPRAHRTRFVRPGRAARPGAASLMVPVVCLGMQVERAANASGARHRGPSGAGTGFRPDYVVVANDVYFCAQVSVLGAWE